MSLDSSANWEPRFLREKISTKEIPRLPSHNHLFQHANISIIEFLIKIFSFKINKKRRDIRHRDIPYNQNAFDTYRECRFPTVSSVFSIRPLSLFLSDRKAYSRYKIHLYKSEVWCTTSNVETSDMVVCENNGEGGESHVSTVRHGGRNRVSRESANDLKGADPLAVSLSRYK